MFGGPDLDVLFVTTWGSGEVPGRKARADPLGGGLFGIYGLGVEGVPEVPVAA
jgi:sugar lactone lactonase YvrE